MVVAADHMGDAHVVIVDDDREIVGRRAVGAQDDQIVELRIGDRDLALHVVADHRRAVCGAFRRIAGATPGGASAGSRSRQVPS